MNGTYTAESVDQYMRRALENELEPHEADNALTALTALTTLHPSLFPFSDTFVRVDKEHISFSDHDTYGIRFDVFGEEGIERSLRIPRGDLRHIETAINSVIQIVGAIL